MGPQVPPARAARVSLLRARRVARGALPWTTGTSPQPPSGPFLHRRGGPFFAPPLTGDIAESEGVHHSYVSRLIRLAFLSPEITVAILDGRQPLGLTAARLMQVSRLPLEWRAQRQALDFS